MQEHRPPARRGDRAVGRDRFQIARSQRVGFTEEQSIDPLGAAVHYYERTARTAERMELAGHGADIGAGLGHEQHAAAGGGRPRDCVADARDDRRGPDELGRGQRYGRSHELRAGETGQGVTHGRAERLRVGSARTINR